MEDLLRERWQGAWDSSKGEAELEVKGHRKGGQQDWAEAWPSPSCFLSRELQTGQAGLGAHFGPSEPGLHLWPHSEMVTRVVP